ncbi:MAG: ATP-binding protein [Bacteroidota bacterium]
MIANATFKQIEVSYFRHEFIKTYLYNLHKGSIVHPEIKVTRLLARESISTGRLRPITSSSSKGDCEHVVLDSSIEGTILFQNARYEIVLAVIKDFSDIYYTVEALGVDPESLIPAALLDLLVKEAIYTSLYRNKFLNVIPIDVRGHTSPRIEIEIAEIEKTSLNEVFLPADVYEALDLFVETLKNSRRVGHALRYLLCGKPGTAKTKAIRAIANEVKGLGTIIFTNGSDDRLESVFELAKNFSPVVICIDDIDFLVGNRERNTDRYLLAKLLQRLDGFIGSDVFVLATTNDKTLVDIAASRPGRFDAILDFEAIGAGYYIPLIKSKTSSEKIISLFDETVLLSLEARKVTGAFVANLVKHLEIISMLEKRELDIDYVLTKIDQLDTGFYRNTSKSKGSIGFSN